ncbi:IclR family transcriptional regulator C-terminal domain-containing protein [Streptomyces phaeofaciens JCM 4814]|uniref:Transcriptional regulator n=1 Tax=Streptomyces phaeofaciens TaxID=68254 RepID=A0A918H1R3_9ACTN|nr:IclR family transcriptional regulator C-terminal domain-containing protein [Streptomyces phaeofaciens]GGT32931.1 transcriptional regulator [Streptomyces phaeofaciens]
MISPADSPPAPTAPAVAVAPLMRGIDVLRRLTEADGTMSLRDLSYATGLPRATVDRIAATLAHMGYVRLDGRDVALLPGVMELGNAYLAAVRLPELLGPHVRALADDLDESVSLVVPDGTELRMIHQVKHRRAMTLCFGIGDVLSVERAAPGALIAAEWPAQTWAEWSEKSAAPADHETRAVPSGERWRAAFTPELCAEAARHGWAEDDQRIEPGLVALGAAVRDPHGRQVCAVSVVSHTSRHDVASLRDAALRKLRRTVAEMEETLRHAPAPSTEPQSGTATWTGTSKQVMGREFVESLARGLTVVTAFGAGRDTLTVADAARATGLVRATARRALLTLEHLGYVVAEGRAFRPTPRILELGFPPLSRISLAELAQPHIEALGGRVHDSASMAVLEGGDIRYTGRAAVYRVMSVNITVGTRFPAYATSMGRVLLAGLPPGERTAVLDGGEPLRPLTVRTVTDRGQLDELLDRVAEQGFALTDGELETGLRSIAVPVRDRAGRVVAAVNVAMHSGRRTEEECLDEVLPQLRATVSRIETDLATAARFVTVPVV